MYYVLERTVVLLLRIKSVVCVFVLSALKMHTGRTYHA